MCVLGFLHVCESVHAWIRGGTFKSQCQSLQWTPKWLAPMYLYNIFIPNVSPHTSTILPRCPFYLVLAPQNIEKRTPTRREFTIFGSPTLNLCSAPIWINIKESNTRNSANLHMGFGKEQQDLKQSTHVFLQKHNLKENALLTLKFWNKNYTWKLHFENPICTQKCTFQKCKIYF
jgi:hypothetical protein